MRVERGATLSGEGGWRTGRTVTRGDREEEQKKTEPSHGGEEQMQALADPEAISQKSMWHSWRHFWAILCHLGASLGLRGGSFGNLKPSLGHLGTNLEHLGANLADLGNLFCYFVLNL